MKPAVTATVMGIAAILAMVGCSTEPTEPKAWMVDTSGWWVPDDPTGCLDETETCQQHAWPVREYYKGGAVAGVFVHGDEIQLECKALTPEAIRNAVTTESKYWYYASFGDEHWWVPDIYVTKDDVDGMAEGVPDCSSDTPGVNGRGS